MVNRLCSLYTVYLSRIIRKSVFGVSDQVRHKPGRTTTCTKDKKVEELYYLCSESKGAFVFACTKAGFLRLTRLVCILSYLRPFWILFEGSILADFITF